MKPSSFTTGQTALHLFSSLGRRLLCLTILLLAVVGNGNTVLAQSIRHTVKKGETLYRISMDYGVSIEQLQEANPGLTPETLKAGAELLIPKGEMKADETGGCRCMHKVKKKETMWGIAAQYGLSLEELQAANQDLAPDFQIKKGQFLCIPHATVPRPTTATQAPVGYDHLRIGIVLPLTNPGIAGNRSLEFYRGFLMAADLLKREGKQITVYAYDEPSDKSSIQKELDEMRSRHVQLIVGPLYPEHFTEIDDFVKRQDGMVALFPFSSKVEMIGRNNRLFMLNAPESKKNEFAARLLIDYFGQKTKVVFVNQESNGNERGFCDYLRYELERNHIPVSIQQSNPTPSQLALQYQSGYKMLLVYNSSGIPTLQRAAQDVAAFRKAHPDKEIALFGYPEWQEEADAYRKVLHEANAYCYTNAFYNPWSKPTQELIARYQSWFHQDLLDVTPRMALLGYDCCMTMLRGLSVYGKDFNIQNLQLPLLQSDITFTQVGEGGFVNNSLCFIHYRPDGMMEKVGLR